MNTNCSRNTKCASCKVAIYIIYIFSTVSLSLGKEKNIISCIKIG